MKISRHARKRGQQRAINDDMILLASLFGEVTRQDKRGVLLQLTERTRTRLRHALDQARDLILVSSPEYETLITVYSIHS